MYGLRGPLLLQDSAALTLARDLRDLRSARPLVVHDYLEQPSGAQLLQAHGHLGGVERPRRVVRFARLSDRRVRDIGGPAARACGRR